ncbi:LCP family protein [Pseudobacteroides cellulosolvens]|uniref:Cell envelope-related transcriptional attenuator n=1 Tax=Pseudobacteroides cellulosolvens ATCC 35603 = DSM 2933 TaxID=398512 RepID=A0A0L6JKJ3_9FIRM|nr:LCP family protein [Pseudobacteroides cellulosolvens]KNY26275.1 cell envelope-related transcriptional attenuator [Pseudobacteroides cellulosolvens ATCC 35603 = DSM 2933]
MNIRKFYLIMTTTVTIFLFSSGVWLLFLINTTAAAPKDGKANTQNNLINHIIQPFVADKNPVNILVLGGDKVAGNTDTMMLVNFTPGTGKISIISTPRDSRVKVKGLGFTKINAAYPRGGADLAVDTLSNFLGVRIKYYVYVDTSAFRKIIDKLDGVDYYVPVDLYYNDPYQNLHINLKKGQQHLDGKKAEQFMRFRKPQGGYSKEMMKYYDGSDLKRIEAQQNFIRELIKQKKNIKYISKASDIIDVILKSVETNITASDALKLAQNISNIDISGMETFMVPGDTASVNGIWYYVPDRKATAKIVEENFQSDLGAAPSYYADEDDRELTRSKNKPKATKNPSNSDTSIKGSKTPKP